MRNRGDKFDVPHAFAADFGLRHFNAAAVANHAFVLYAFVFPAATFPVASMTKNPFTKETVLFRLQGAVIDGFRFTDLPMRTGTDSLRRGHLDRNAVKHVYFKIHRRHE